MNDAKKKSKLLEDEKRLKAVKYVNKWDDFRERRDQIFKRYIYVKHRRERMDILCRIINHFSVVKCLYQSYCRYMAYLAFQKRLIFYRS